MDQQQLALLLAQRNAELALLLAFITSRPVLCGLFSDADVVISIRKGHPLPQVRIEDKIRIELVDQPKAG